MTMQSAATPARKKPARAPARARARAKRTPAARRKAQIVAEATTFFATHGFDGSTRDLAEIIGVRQALLYKYFADKDALIAAVLAEAFGERGPHEWLDDRSGIDLTLGELISRISPLRRSIYGNPERTARIQLALYALLSGRA